jgi:hypothetical protein
MDRLDVMKNLRPFQARIHNCISRGFHDARKHHELFLHIFTKRTISSITRDYIWDYIRKEFTTEETVKFREQQNGLCLLIINDVVFLRFKKLNTRKCSSNIPTLQATLYERQQLLMFEPRPCAHLNAGYIANETWTNLEVYITEPNGKRSNAWVMKIYEDEQRQSVIELPVSRTEKPRRFKPKTGTGQEQKGADNEGTRGN